MNIHDIWRRITATRYTRALEREVVRLRAENRALLNSILGIAGVPPITVIPDSVSIGAQSAAADARRAAAAAGAPQPTGRVKKKGANGNAREANAVTPTRRRSWHQIYRMLEIDSAKKKPQETVDIPPATTRS